MLWGKGKIGARVVKQIGSRVVKQFFALFNCFLRCKTVLQRESLLSIGSRVADRDT